MLDIIPEANGWLFELTDINKMKLEADRAIVINDLADVGVSFYRVLLEKHDEYEMVASCDCGELKGNFYIGVTCDKCKTKVKIEKFPNIDVFVRIPFDYEVLHPRFYLILKNTKKSMASVIDYIMDPMSTTNSTTIKKFITQYNITGKGLKYLKENFDYIFRCLIDFFGEEELEIELEESKEDELETAPTKKSKIKLNKYMELQALKTLYNQNKDKLFVKFLPLISNYHSYTVYAKNQIHTEEIIKELFLSLSDFVFLEKRKRINKQKAENIIVQAYKNYITYLNNLSNKIKDKKGLFRRNIYGSNYYFSFRAVVIPIMEPHFPDELHVSYKILVKLLKFHIIGVLRKKFNMKTFDAYNKIQKAIAKFDKDIYDIIQYLIDDCPFKGIPVVLNRNPTIKTGSLVQMFITKIIPHGEILAVPFFVIPWLNMDFDGDTGNNFLVLELDNVIKGYDPKKLEMMGILKPGESQYFPDIQEDVYHKGTLSLHSYNQIIGHTRTVNVFMPEFLFTYITNFYNS